MNRETATEIITRAGLNPADWNVPAAVKDANRWIADQQAELAEGGSIEEFGSLTVADFLQQCVADNSWETVTDEQYLGLWNRVDDNEFADWPPVWAA